MDKTFLPVNPTISFQDIERAFGETITLPPDKAFYPPLFHPMSLSVWVEVVTSEEFRSLRSRPLTSSVPALWTWVLLRFETRCREMGKQAFASPTDRSALNELYVDLSDLRRKAIKFLNEFQLFRKWEVRLDKKIVAEIHTGMKGITITTKAPLKPVDKPTALIKDLTRSYPGPTFHGHNRGGMLHRSLYSHRSGSTVEFVLDLTSPSVHPTFSMVIRSPKRPFLSAGGKLLSEKQVIEVAYRQVWLPLTRLHRVDALHVSRLF